MTDKQFQEYKETLLKLVLEKIQNSENLQDAEIKIKELLNK